MCQLKETARVHKKNKTQLYVMYKKPTLNIKRERERERERDKL